LCKTKLADGAKATQVKIDVANDAMMVVQQDGVASAFVGLVTFLDFLVIRFVVQAIKMGVQRVNFHDESVDVVFREQVAVVTDSICTVLRTDLVAKHLVFTTGVPLAAVLLRGSNDGGMDKTGTTLVVLWVCSGRMQSGVLVVVVCRLEAIVHSSHHWGFLGVGARRLARVAGPWT
jgi:hypothetical protein